MECGRTSTLVARWRLDADLLERHGAAEAAATARLHASQLEDALVEQANEALTLQEATRESGYSERRLRELIASGEVTNAGARGRPRIRRADLPRKPRREGGTFDPTASARSILGRAAGTREA